MITKAAILVCIGITLAYPDGKNSHATSQNPIVTTPLGQIQGSTLISRLGKPIYSFRGVRYAKSPCDELRFQPPQPVTKWEGIYNATEDGPVCPQPTTDPVSEDCLLLNVYSTKLPTEGDNPKRPVIVHLHAGGFYSATARSNWGGPQYLMDQDIVLVNINYRLGTLGFLSTGDKEAPGNNGLKDQVEAMKWVKNNILAFGGNPDSVTLLGYSAGAVSATLHMVSPLSQGLFHRVVAMSGSPFGTWPIKSNQLDLAKKQARIMNCPDDTSANIVKCLRTKSAIELGESLPKFAEFGLDPVLIWSPVIEGEFGQQRFLTAHPITLIQEGHFQKVPYMGGVTTDEFSNRAFDVLADPKLVADLNQEWEKYAPIAFLYERNTDNSKTISKAVRNFYFGDKPIDNSSLSSLAQAYADGITGIEMIKAVKLISERSTQPVYYYRFNYKGRFSHFYLPDSNGTVPYGVVHHDDLIYLFYISTLFPRFKDADPEVPTVEKMTTIMANFARTGNPIPEPTEKLDNVKWEPYTVKTQKYLNIGNKLVMAEKLYEKRYAEWEKLFPLSQ